MNLFDKLDNYIYWNIMDFAKGVPKDKYKNVMTELRYNIRVRCNKNCRYQLLDFDGELIPVPVFVKTSHAICPICDCSTLSEYSHRHCDQCSAKGTYEYNYHHRFCMGFNHDNHPITDPL